MRGREILEREIKKQGSELADWVRTDKLQEASKRFNFLSVEELYAAVGVGTLSALQVIGKLKEDFQKERKASLGEEEQVNALLETRPRAGRGRRKAGVRVLGLDNMAVRFSHCCNPLPGDVIAGYITRGRGVSIHRADCPNLSGYRRNEPERIIEVAWDAESQPGYHVEVEVKAMDRSRLTTDVMNTIADSRIPIISVYARANKQKQATINLTLEINNVEHLQSILQKSSESMGSPTFAGSAFARLGRGEMRLRAVVQQVREARVKVEDQLLAETGAGLVVLLGVENGDNQSDMQYIADKVACLRVFDDSQGKMNLSALIWTKKF